MEESVNENYSLFIFYLFFGICPVSFQPEQEKISFFFIFHRSKQSVRDERIW